MFSAIASILGKVYKPNDNPNSLYVHEEPVTLKSRDPGNPYAPIAVGFPSRRAQPGDIIVDQHLKDTEDLWSEVIGREVRECGFKAEEFFTMQKTPRRACAIGGTKVRKHTGALIRDVLIPVREKYGGPVRIANGYRPSDYNHAVGGAPNSAHITGEAADVEAEDMVRLMKACVKLWRKHGRVLKLGIGIYGSIYRPTRVHLDIAGFRHWGANPYAVKLLK